MCAGGLTIYIALFVINEILYFKLMFEGGFQGYLTYTFLFQYYYIHITIMQRDYISYTKLHNLEVLFDI